MIRIRACLQACRNYPYRNAPLGAEDWQNRVVPQLRQACRCRRIIDAALAAEGISITEIPKTAQLLSPTCSYPNSSPSFPQLTLSLTEAALCCSSLVAGSSASAALPPT